jgi:ribose transport system permease protein
MIPSAALATSDPGIGVRSATVRRLIIRFAPQLLLALLVLALLAIQPSVLAPISLVNVLVYSSTIVVLALGAMWVLIGGGLDLSAGVGVSMCAMVLGALIQGGSGLWVALSGTLVAGLLLGAVNGTLVGVIGMPPFIATLATNQAVLGVTLVLGGMAGTVILNDPVLAFVGTGSVGPIPLPIIYASIVVLVVWFLARWTSFGLHTYSIGSNREATVARGVHVVRQDLLIYLFSGLMVALTAILLVARVQIVDPRIAGLTTLLDAFAATILGGTSLFGGRGTVGGTVTGALIIGLLSTSLVTLGVGPESVQLMKGAFIVIAVVVDAMVRVLERAEVPSAPVHA